MQESNLPEQRSKRRLRPSGWADWYRVPESNRASPA